MEYLNIVKRVEYLPFGETRISTGSYDKIKLGFTNQYQDEESGLYYYKRRYYNPELGRFISADPLYLEEMNTRATDTQELNVYAYVRNNPLKYVDPSGEFNSHFMGMLSSAGVAGQFQKEAEVMVNAYGTAGAVATGVAVSPFVIAGGVAATPYAISISPALMKAGSEVVSGAFDGAAPSSPLEYLGWSLANLDTIQNSFDGFSSLDSVSHSKGSVSIDNDEFRFYDSNTFSSEYYFEDQAELNQVSSGLD